MVLPYVHATAMVLTLISTVHPRGAVRRRLEDGICTGGVSWKKNLDRLTRDRQRAISSLSKMRSRDDPDGEMFTGAPISLSHGKLAATVNLYRFIDAENSTRVRSHFGPTK